MKTIRFGSIAAFMAITAFLVIELAGAGKEDTTAKAALRTFMRQKLAYSQGIVEGLSLEKFDLISKNALRMKNMTQSNLWVTIKQADYTEHTEKFQHNIDALFKAASDKDLDAATDAYVRVTKDCVACHRHLRLEQRKVVPNQLLPR